MPFAQSFYADQKLAVKPQETASPAAAAAVPAVTPIAEDPLSPAQIQEAIRIYRSVLSSSAPSSPVRHAQAPAVPERPAVHSNYYGGGPTDIPQSYLLNYTTSPSRAPAPAPAAEAPAPALVELSEEEQLIARLQALQLQKQGNVPPSPVSAPVEPTSAAPPQSFRNTVPKKTPLAQRMYDDEESGYCFNRQKDAEQEGFEEAPAEEPQQLAAEVPPVVAVAPQQCYTPAPAPTNYSKVMSGPSEYIGMANDNKFIYDAQKSLPVSYTQNNSYTLVNAVPQAVIVRPEEHEEHGTTTTEDVTQVPASPAVTSRFRGLVKNVQTPVQATAPIVVERVAEPSYHASYNNNNYGAFMPVNQLSMESEYQLPVLNDLASCIEHY